MKNIFYNIFCSNYFLVFSSKECNYCWKVVSKKIFVPLPKMINEIVEAMEKEGKTNVALLKIEKI